MKQPFEATNNVDDEDNPAGGYASGVGFSISWQNGPLVVDGERREPTGAFVETILAVVKQRIEHYQESRFACSENAQALEHIEAALESLDSRTKDREERGVEGTHEV